MEQSNSGKRWALGVAVLVAFGVGLWRSGGDDADMPAPPLAEVTREEPEATAERGASEVQEPDYTIAESGRLTLLANALPLDGPLHLALDLTDDARGDTPREVRIGAGDGRELRILARNAPGSGSGLRLEVDPGWLKPGHYLIEVKTDEASHLPLRRYALIVE